VQLATTSSVVVTAPHLMKASQLIQESTAAATASVSENIEVMTSAGTPSAEDMKRFLEDALENTVVLSGSQAGCPGWHVMRRTGFSSTTVRLIPEFMQLHYKRSMLKLEARPSILDIASTVQREASDNYSIPDSNLLDDVEEHLALMMKIAQRTAVSMPSAVKAVTGERFDEATGDELHAALDALGLTKPRRSPKSMPWSDELISKIKQTLEPRLFEDGNKSNQILHE